MKFSHLKRTAVLAGLVCASMGAVLLAPAAAQANVTNPPQGSQPGALTWNPGSSTDYNSFPNFQTSSACPAPNNAFAFIEVIGNDGNEYPLSSVFQGAQIQQTNGFSGSVGASVNDIIGIGAPVIVPGQTFEITVDCRASLQVHGVYVQSTFLTIPADGVSAWTTSSSPGPVVTPTTTTLTPPTQTVGVGDNVTVTASVSPSNAAGTVQFKDGTNNLGSPVAVSGGTAQFSTTALAVGTHSITGSFVPTNTAAFSGSTSQAVTVVVTSGNVQAETINVNVPTAEGPFIMTVSTTPVSLGTATLSSDFTHFSASGTLGDVSVSDQRNQSVPGWTITGQVSAFSDGSHTIPGTVLGWTPNVKTQNAASDITAGSAVTAGSNPGLTGASTLATAGTGKGLGSSVLSAGLDFEAPANTQPGAYSATLTITAMP